MPRLVTWWQLDLQAKHIFFSQLKHKTSTKTNLHPSVANFYFFCSTCHGPCPCSGKGWYISPHQRILSKSTKLRQSRGSPGKSITCHDGHRWPELFHTDIGSFVILGEAGYIPGARNHWPSHQRSGQLGEHHRLKLKIAYIKHSAFI